MGSQGPYASRRLFNSRLDGSLLLCDAYWQGELRPDSSTPTLSLPAAVCHGHLAGRSGHLSLLFCGAGALYPCVETHTTPRIAATRFKKAMLANAILLMQLILFHVHRNPPARDRVSRLSVHSLMSFCGMLTPGYFPESLVFTPFVIANIPR